MVRLNLRVPVWIQRRRRPETRAILVIGVGGGGGNAVDRMIAARVPGVRFVACNTDAQALRRSTAATKIRIGASTTRGLGSGGDPAVGRRSAEEDEAGIARSVTSSDLVFIIAGLGGGTGSGAAPIIGADARVEGALTIAIVTKPFAFEGVQRMRIADMAVADLADSVDAIITIPNDRVVDVVAEDTTMLDAFRVVDDVLLQAVQGIIDLLKGSGLVNVDFADVRAVMQGAGAALVGLGRGSGENRAIDAARQAITSPMLEANIQGAHGILFNVSGPADLRLNEVLAAASEVRASADPDANVIFGASLGAGAGDEVVITLIATGLAWPTTSEVAARATKRIAVETTIGELPEPEPTPVEIEPPVGGDRGRKPRVASRSRARKTATPAATQPIDTPPVDAPPVDAPPAEAHLLEAHVVKEICRPLPSFLRRS